MGHRLLRLTHSKRITNMEELSIVLRFYPSIWDASRSTARAIPSRYFANRPFWEVAYKLSYGHLFTTTPKINTASDRAPHHRKGVRRRVTKIPEQQHMRRTPCLGGGGVPVIFECGHEGHSFSRRIGSQLRLHREGKDFVIWGRCHICVDPREEQARRERGLILWTVTI